MWARYYGAKKSLLPFGLLLLGKGKGRLRIKSYTTIHDETLSLVMDQFVRGGEVFKPQQ